MNKQKSFYPKGNQDEQRRWYLCNAADRNLGRLATLVARILMGKNKPTYTPSVDMGDYVIVTNSKMVKVTGNKYEDKKYYRHTGYPGGLKVTTFKELQGKYPDRIIMAAVKGMLPKNTIGKAMLKKLKVFPGDSHNHEAQKPIVINDQGESQ